MNVRAVMVLDDDHGTIQHAAGVVTIVLAVHWNLLGLFATGMSDVPCSGPEFAIVAKFRWTTMRISLSVASVFDVCVGFVSGVASAVRCHFATISAHAYVELGLWTTGPSMSMRTKCAGMSARIAECLRQMHPARTATSLSVTSVSLVT